MFEFFLGNNLIFENQSGFGRGDSCKNQFLQRHGLKRWLFLDISKAFDKVWDNGLINTLKENEISGDLLSVLTNFLTCRKQKVAVNGLYFSWANIEAVAPQGFINCPFMFLIYINDFSENLSSNLKLFFNGTSLFPVACNKDTSFNNLNNGMNKINYWVYEWKINFNPDPNKQAQKVIFTGKIYNIAQRSLTFNDSRIHQAAYQKHLIMR